MVILLLDKIARVFLSLSAREGLVKCLCKHLRRSKFLEILFTKGSFFRYL